MKFKETIGIDISKLTIDVRIHSNQMLSVFENNKSGFSKFIKWKKQNINFDDNQILIAFEHTGIYSYELCLFLSDRKLPFVLIPGLEIKRSLGIQRGKDDSIDAKKIAEYAFLKRDKLVPYVLPKESLLKLKRLLSLRELLVKQRTAYIKNKKEYHRILTQSENKVLFNAIDTMLKSFNKEIGKVEIEIDQIISQDEQLFQQFALITSIIGVGKQTALFSIILTDAFNSFDEWRKFASYSGTAPFPHKSGISIRGKNKVSHLANKKMKSLLNQCAKSAIIHNPELRAYYLKKLAEGKNKMCVLNSVRNKIIARIFAVVQRGTPYVNTFKFAS